MPSPTQQNQPPSLAQVLSDLQRLDTSLADRLKAYAAHSASRYPDLAKAYDALVVRLERLVMMRHARTGARGREYPYSLTRGPASRGAGDAAR